MIHVVGMGRKRRLVARVVRPCDIDVFTALQKRFGSAANESTRVRVVKTFLEFSALNGFDDLAVGLRWFIGVQRNQDEPLMWSTISSYCRYIRAYIRRHIKLPELQAFDMVYKLVRLAHADEDCACAVVATNEDVRLFLGSCSAEEVPLQAAVLMITRTGLRLADIKRLRRKQLFMTRKLTRVEVRVAKNRRQRCLRRILRLNPAEIWSGENPEQLVGFVEKSTDPEALLFSKVTIPAINDYIKKKNPSLSSYSFRKRFIEDIAAWTNFDWTRTIKFTLHCNEDVVAAHYDTLMANVKN